MKDENTRSRKRKKRVLRKRFIILAPLLLVVILVSTYALHLYSKAESAATQAQDKNIQRDKSDLRETKVDPKFDNVSILMMGIDSSDERGSDDNARTDALMVATFNKEEKSVKLLTIPRDSYVYLPEVGYETKINHAHAQGGPQASINAVEELLEIPIDYYVRINFEAFLEAVEAVGGVTVDVPFEFYEQDSKDKANAIHLKPGVQELNGEEALAFTRTRKMDNDIERGKRQQEILKALLQKSLSAKSIFKYDDVIEAVGNNMKTNLSFKDMKSLFSYLSEGSSLDIESLTIDGEDYKPGSVYYWKLDDRSRAKAINTLEKHLNLPVTDFGYDFSEEEGEEDGMAENDDTNEQEDTSEQIEEPVQ